MLANALAVRRYTGAYSYLVRRNLVCQGNTTRAGAPGPGFSWLASMYVDVVITLLFLSDNVAVSCAETWLCALQVLFGPPFLSERHTLATFRLGLTNGAVREKKTPPSEQICDLAAAM